MTTTIAATPARRVCFRSRKQDLAATHDWFRPRRAVTRNLRLFRRVRARRTTSGLVYEPTRPSWLPGVSLTDAEVEEFRDIYKRTTGKEVELDTAREMATTLMAFVHALVRPTTAAPEQRHD